MARHEHDADTIEDTRPVEDTRAREMTPARRRSMRRQRRPVFDYDTPPKEWVAGTVVPEDTAPEDMTDAEYIQWMYDNLTPFWAIKRNMLLRRAPVLSSDRAVDGADWGREFYAGGQRRRALSWT